MGRYEDALAGLNAAQRQAVTTTEGPVLVIAGPGTGKTQLLTTRIAHILATTDTLPQNILCLTFTDSAAHTMRDRLAGMIGQAAYDVTISTYHAFGSDIIRRYPDFFTSQTDMQPIDDLGIDGIFREIINGLPYSNPLKYSDAYLGDIKSLVSDAKRALIAPDDMRTIAAHNLAFITSASPMVGEALATMVRISKKDIPLFAHIAEALQPYAQKGKSPTSQIIPLATLLTNELNEALAEAEEAGKQTPLTKWKNAWLAKDEAGRFVIDGVKTNQKLQAAADVYESYLTELRARGLFDYDDMILRAVQALETNNDLRYTLQEQYLYILLDEFQDTNGAQLRIVELLTDNPVNEGRPNVLAVGDDDQAIYAFQGASYSHMVRFKDMYRDVLPVPLTQNYRSHADILHTARGIAEQIETRLHHHFPEIEKTLTADNPTLPKQAVIERREARSDVMQYAWVAHRIKQLIDEGTLAPEIAVLAPQHRYIEPLVPFLQQYSIPIRYDKRENVLDDPVLNQLVRMAELCQALSGGDHGTASALWAEVISFGFWNIPTSVIWKLSWQTNDEDQTWTEALLEDAALKPIALFFIRLSQLAAKETLETMLDYLIGSVPLDLGESGYESFRSPYYEHYFGALSSTAVFSFSTAPAPNEQSPAAAAFWELLTNLIVLRTKLREYKRDQDERLYLAHFIEFVEAHREADIKILNTSPYASGADAVQLMTAFKSKGMEFAAVFVLAVNDEAWGDRARSGGSRISLPANLQFIRYAGATSDERLRLFYVAITRAKTKLFMVNYTQNYAGKAMSRLKYLDESTNEGGESYSPLLPDTKQRILSAEDTVPAPTAELAAYWHHRHEAALDHESMRVLLENRLSQFQLSPTHVNDFVDVAQCGPRAFFMRTVLRFPQAPRPQVQFGNAIHETLEWIHGVARDERHIPALAAVEKLFEQRLRAKRLNEHDTSQFLDRGHVALKAYLSQRQHTIAPDNRVEYSFRGEGVFIGKAHLAGKVDKLIIDRQAKTITIVDYKTGKGHSRWTRDVKMHRYRQQLYLYRALVEGSHTFAGCTVTDAYLEFVEPDEQGVIHELHLQFDQAEYERTKRIAEAAWRHITTITLPDSSQYSADLAGIEAFENDLLQNPRPLDA